MLNISQAVTTLIIITLQLFIHGYLHHEMTRRHNTDASRLHSGSNLTQDEVF